jgi:Domain of unknown function (DUF4397)
VGLIVLLAAPMPAWAGAPEVRFLHAVPGAGPARLVVPHHPPLLLSTFGKPSAYHACRPGPARLLLMVRGNPKPVATGRTTIGHGRYTVVAAEEGHKVALRVYRDDGMRPGKARLRVIQAAAEMGRADVRVDGRVIAPAMSGGAATHYASLEPGRHDLEVTRPGGRGGPLANRPGVPLAAGTASTAIVVGTGGELTRFILVSDAVAGPASAPATGFVGGEDPPGAWLAVIGAALVAGALGGAAYTVTTLVKGRRSVPASTPSTGASGGQPSSSAMGHPGAIETGPSAHGATHRGRQEMEARRDLEVRLTDDPDTGPRRGGVDVDVLSLTAAHAVEGIAELCRVLRRRSG